MRRRGNQTYARSGMSGLCNPRINLFTRKMSTLTGLCALCHLDLNFLCAYQILTGYSESSGCHLLNCGTLIQSILTNRQTVNALTTFTGIGLSMKGIHGNCQCLMCFLGNGTIGHRTGFKPGYDGIHILDFIDRNRLCCIIEIKQAT